MIFEKQPWYVNLFNFGTCAQSSDRGGTWAPPASASSSRRWSPRCPSVVPTWTAVAALGILREPETVIICTVYYYPIIVQLLLSYSWCTVLHYSWITVGIETSAWMFLVKVQSWCKQGRMQRLREAIDKKPLFLTLIACETWMMHDLGIEVGFVLSHMYGLIQRIIKLDWMKTVVTIIVMWFPAARGKVKHNCLHISWRFQCRWPGTAQQSRWQKWDSQYFLQ